MDGRANPLLVLMHLCLRSLSLSLFFLCLSVSFSVCDSLSLSLLFYLSIYLSTYLSIHIPSIYLSIILPIYLSVCLFICPDLLTSLTDMSPVLPRELHLCRSSSNVPRLPIVFATRICSLLARCQIIAPATRNHILRAKGLSHISWAEVTSTPCNSELEESHINWAKVTSK